MLKPLTCDPDGPLLAEVIKTTSEPYVGKLSLVRVFSEPSGRRRRCTSRGTSAADSSHQDHDVDERIGSLFSPLGKSQQLVSECGPGTSALWPNWAGPRPGTRCPAWTTRCSCSPGKCHNLCCPRRSKPARSPTRTKLAKALGRLLAEDPSLWLESEEDTGQQVLWCLGEAHLDVVMDRPRERLRVAVDTAPLRVSLRETFADTGQGHGRNVKQSGGHGQYGV